MRTGIYISQGLYAGLIEYFVRCTSLFVESVIQHLRTPFVQDLLARYAACTGGATFSGNVANVLSLSASLRRAKSSQVLRLPLV